MKSKKGFSGLLKWMFFKEPAYTEVQDTQSSRQNIISKGVPDPARTLSDQDKYVRLLIRVNGKEQQVEIVDFPCVIGRDAAEAAIALGDSSISRKHAVMDFGAAGLTILDSGSKNGVELNGRRIKPGAAEAVAEGALLRIGRAELRVTEVSGDTGYLLNDETEYIGFTELISPLPVSGGGRTEPPFFEAAGYGQKPEKTPFPDESGAFGEFHGSDEKAGYITAEDNMRKTPYAEPRREAFPSDQAPGNRPGADSYTDQAIPPVAASYAEPRREAFPPDQAPERPVSERQTPESRAPENRADTGDDPDPAADDELIVPLPDDDAAKRPVNLPPDVEIIPRIPPDPLPAEPLDEPPSREIPREEPRPVFCPFCGYRNSSIARFCAQCGRNIE
jgi:pSer/pThr/pTyr-binding forkhead associated (FHA) protein